MEKLNHQRIVMAVRWSPQQPLRNVMQKGALYRQFENMRAAKKIAAMIAPMCDDLRLGVPIEPNMIRVSVKRVRIEDADPYALNYETDALSQVREEVRAEVSLPSNAMITKFKQILPTLQNYMAMRGLGAVKLAAVLDVSPPPPKPFLRTEMHPRLSGKEASEGARELAERLPKSSPLKAEMQRLAESLSNIKK